MIKLINQIDEIRNSTPDDQIIRMLNPQQWIDIIESKQYSIVENVYNSLQPNNGRKTISRKDLFETSNIQERIVKAMMWAFPNENKDTPVHIVLSELPYIVSCINESGNDFVRLYGRLTGINGIADSTTSIIMYIAGLKLYEKRALAITSHTLNAFRKFDELKVYCDLGYIPQLLALHQEAERIGFDAEQLEYYLFRVSSEKLKLI